MDCEYLRKKAKIENEIEQAKSVIEEKEKELQALIENQNKHGLTNVEISKYSRQIILPAVRVQGQVKLKNSSVLIVGCGGLGCPAAQYLAGSGVGRIGLIDYDLVEPNNLHRQVLHSEGTIGVSKVESVAASLNRLNSCVEIEKYSFQLDSTNALTIFPKYDVVIDASDNPATRYLVNDACVLSGKPLISGSAVKMEGQLTVYHYKDGPCYRCLFPRPPVPEAVSNCGDVGVLGPRVIGVLQALQALHILLENPGDLSGKLLIFDGSESSFRIINLRKRNENCTVCGKVPTIKKLVDYEKFCGCLAMDKNPQLRILGSTQRILPRDLMNIIKNDSPPHVLIDVRHPFEFEICSLPGSVNLPLESLTSPQVQTTVEEMLSSLEKKAKQKPVVFVLCRRGNDSQIGVRKLSIRFDEFELYDLKGGLHAWAKDVDPSFPVY